MTFSDPEEKNRGHTQDAQTTNQRVQKPVSVAFEGIRVCYTSVSEDSAAHPGAVLVHVPVKGVVSGSCPAQGHALLLL